MLLMASGMKKRIATIYTGHGDAGIVQDLLQYEVDPIVQHTLDDREMVDDEEEAVLIRGLLSLLESASTYKSSVYFFSVELDMVICLLGCD